MSLRVLVVDDSAVVRQLLRTLLEEEGMEVHVAADPILALGRLKLWEPDVILLDLEMPRMDGLTFLRQLRGVRTTPVVICSGVAGERGLSAVRALEQGACEIVQKPRVGLKEFFEESRTQIIDAVRAAAAARPTTRVVPARARVGSLPPPTGARPVAVIAIGASTGGTEALREVLATLPRETPGVVIVQHMPAGFTAPFAARLNEASPLEVIEARTGELIRPGLAMVAPGGKHLVIRRGREGLLADVVGGPLVSRHRPSVDMLFRSVAEAAGGSAVAALMTGMGDDGAAGLAALRAAGAVTLAQDEATSVVWGMPKAAIDAGVVDEVVPLPLLAAAIRRHARGT